MANNQTNCFALSYAMGHETNDIDSYVMVGSLLSGGSSKQGETLECLCSHNEVKKRSG